MTLPGIPIVGTRTLAALLLLLPTFAAAEPEIYRCPQPDGSVAFQGMPCPGTEAADVDEEASTEPDDESIGDEGFVNPFDRPSDAQETEPEASAAYVQEALSADRIACEETTRRAIDAIDAELAANTPSDDAKSRLDELLALTRQLRACKTL